MLLWVSGWFVQICLFRSFVCSDWFVQSSLFRVLCSDSDSFVHVSSDSFVQIQIRCLS